MKRFVVALVSAGLLAPAVSSAADSGRWRRIETPDFIIIGDAGDKKLQHAARSMQLYRHALATAVPQINRTLPVKARLFLLSDGTFDRHMQVQRYVQGFASLNEFSADLVSSMVGWDVQKTITLHELTHYFVGNSLSLALPYWYEEGIAEFLATTSEYRGGVAVGFPNARRWLEAREMAWIPLPDLLIKNRVPLAAGTHAGYDAFYAQSWLLVHYLFVGKPDLAPRFAQLIAYFDQGVPAARALSLVFSEQELATIDAALRAYRNSSRMSYLRLALPELTAVPASQPLSDAEAATEMGLMLLRRGNPALRAGAAELLQAGAQHKVARAGAALDYLAASDPAGVDRPFVAQHCSDNLADAVALELCGDALRVALENRSHTDAARETAVQQMRGFYSAAIRLDPRAYAARTELASSHRDDVVPADVLAGLEQAITQFPRAVRMRITAAEAYVRSDELPRAREHLERALLQTRSFDERRDVLKLLQRVETAVADRNASGRPQVD